MIRFCASYSFGLVHVLPSANVTDETVQPPLLGALRKNRWSISTPGENVPASTTFLPLSTVNRTREIGRFASLENLTLSVPGPKPTRDVGTSGKYATAGCDTTHDATSPSGIWARKERRAEDVREHRPPEYASIGRRYGLAPPRGKALREGSRSRLCKRSSVRLLIVEDDERLADVLRRGLEEQGHVIDRAADGHAGEDLARELNYDAIVLDLNLPGRDGLAVLRSLRAAGIATPIVIATSRDETEDVVEGLDAGADDYIRKPFALRELLARLRTVLRREAPPAPVVLQVDTLRFDLATRHVMRGSRDIILTARELAFLEYFMRNTGIVLTRPMIETALWDRTSETTSNVVDVYVRRLRMKIDMPGEMPLLHTVRGIGYRMSE